MLLGPKLALTLLYPWVALLALHGGTVVGRERFDLDQAEAADLRYSAWVWGDDCVTRGQEHWGEHWARFFDGLHEIGVQGPGRRLYVSAGHIVANASGFQNFFDFTRAASEQGLGIELLFVQHDPWNVAAEKMAAQAELSCDLITACRTAAAGPAQCPVAIHYDLEGGNPRSVNNMTLGAGLVHQVLAKAGLAQSVGLHFDSFNGALRTAAVLSQCIDEWSNAESTRLGNATIPQSAFPCHWDHDPSAGPISINECLLKANATRLHIEDYHTQAEDFNAASNDKFEAMCGAYLAPHPWGTINGSLATLELVDRLKRPGTIVLGSGCDGNPKDPPGVDPERHHGACGSFWWWSFEKLRNVSRDTLEWYGTHRPSLLAGLAADSEGGGLALENSASCKQIPATSLSSPPSPNSVPSSHGRRSTDTDVPRMDMWWWGAPDVILGNAQAQEKFLGEIRELGAGGGSVLYGQATKLVSREHWPALKTFLARLEQQDVGFHFLMTAPNRSMATPTAVQFIGEVAAFASWAGISHPVAHFDLEPRSDRLAQETYLAMLPVLVHAAAHPMSPTLATLPRPGGPSVPTVRLHFDTQHRMGGIRLPCPLLSGANVSMARCVLEAGNLTLMAYSSQWRDFLWFKKPCTNPDGCTIQGIVNTSLWTLQDAPSTRPHSITIGVQTDCLYDEPWSSFCKTNLSWVSEQVVGAVRWFAESPFATVLSQPVPMAMECFGNYRRLLK